MDDELLFRNLAYLGRVVQAQRDGGEHDANIEASGAQADRPMTEAEAAAEALEILRSFDLKAATEGDLAARRRHSRIVLSCAGVALGVLFALLVLGRALPEPIQAVAPDPGVAAAMTAMVAGGALCLAVLGATVSLLLGPRSLSDRTDRVDYRWGTYPRIMAGTIVGFLVGMLLFRPALKLFLYDTTSDPFTPPIVTGVLATFAGGLATRFVLGWLPFPFSLPKP